MIDIYFDENYGKLYEKVENGKQEVFCLKTENGTIKNIYIKREIPIAIENKKYYDIVTPYGYGGPIIEEVIHKEQLLSEYQNEFEQYCLKNNIVAEFVRFHPLVNNAYDFEDCYTVIKNRKTLGTDLKLENPVKEEFSKSCRKNIRQALNKGVTYRVTKSPENIDVFKTIYYSTMDRNGASDYYYFDDEYFNNILKYFKDNILLVEAKFEGKTIACGLYFIYNNTIHIHLSGTLTEYLYLSPAYILRYAVTLWGKENDYEIIHHGGGRSSSEEDTLYKFKKGFAQKTEFDFFIGKKVWNKNVYETLCELTNTQIDGDFFPAYRSKI